MFNVTLKGQLSR